MALAGSFIWHDLVTIDTDAAKDFYSEVVGWGMENWRVEIAADQPTYRAWIAGEWRIGGLMALREKARQMGVKPHWSGFVKSDDIDLTAARVGELGGRVLVGPRDMPGAKTRFLVFKDPQGGSLACLADRQDDEEDEQDQTEAPETEQDEQDEQDEGQSEPNTLDAENGIGLFAWNELITSDAAAAWTFYSNLFGWKKVDVLETPMGLYTVYMVDEEEGAVGGIIEKRPEMQAPAPAWLYYVCVTDLEAALEQVKARGGRPIEGPLSAVPGGGGRLVHCLDPQGVAFGLHSHATGRGSDD